MVKNIGKILVENFMISIIETVLQEEIIRNIAVKFMKKPGQSSIGVVNQVSEAAKNAMKETDVGNVITNRAVTLAAAM
ncbi:MAG: hypothetical protein WC188_04500 [Candidatus Caldatribacteriota bacterium]|nr:hypothetical protein [Patescibacteria group bacterium]